MINQKDIYHKLNQKNLLFFLAIFFLLYLFFSPTFITANEYAFISTSKNFLSSNNYYIGYSESIRAFLIKLPAYFLFNNFDYEIVHKILKTLSLLFFSYAIFHFSKSFKISNISILISILVFILSKQSYFGTENILSTIELKTFSYISIILAFSFLQKKNVMLSIFLSSFSIYSHFLVGYFWAGALCIFYYLKIKNLKIVLIFFLKIFLISIPITVILFYENYYNFNPLLQTSYNDIFFERHKGFTTPFTDSYGIKKSWIFGYIFIFANLNIFIFLKKKLKKNLNNELFLLLILLNIYFFALTLFLYFDRNFFLIKFIPFRPESLILLFTLFCIFELIFDWFRKKNIRKQISILITIILISLSPLLLGSNINLLRVTQIIIQKGHITLKDTNKFLKDHLEDNDKDLINWVKKETNEDDIVLFEDGRNLTSKNQKDIYLFVRENNFEISKILSSSWETIVNRPAYVTRDVIGGNFNELIDWRKRLEQKNSVYKGKCEVLNNIPVLYIVAFKKDSKINLDKCFKSSLINFGKYYIYKNEK